MAFPLQKCQYPGTKISSTQLSCYQRIWFYSPTLPENQMVDVGLSNSNTSLTAWCSQGNRESRVLPITTCASPLFTLVHPCSPEPPAETSLNSNCSLFVFATPCLFLTTQDVQPTDISTRKAGYRLRRTFANSVDLRSNTTKLFAAIPTQHGPHNPSPY